MNKGELVTTISERTDVSKADVERVLKAFEEVAQQIVAAGTDKLTLPGFFSVEQSSRAARVGRNPRTGEPQQIAAKKAVKLTAGSTLKAVANGEKPAPS
jgi:DNA-binding protein HU-beta